MLTSSGSQAVIKVLLSNVDSYYENDDDNNDLNARRQNAPHYGRARQWHREDEGVRRRRHASEHVLSSPFAVFVAKYKSSSTKARAVMHDFLDRHVVDKPSFIEIEMESQSQYAVSRLYATSKLPAIELQTKPRLGMFAKQAYRKAEFELVVWGKVMLTDTAVPHNVFFE